MADDRTKVSSLPLGDNLDDDDLLMTVEDGVSKKAEVGYLKTKFTEDLANVSRSGSYNDLSNTPTIPDELADLTDDSTHRLVTDTEKSTWNAKQSALTFDDVPTDGSNNPVKSNGIYDALATKANTSDVPTALADLSDDSTHRVVTDTEKTTWNAKSDFSGSYTDLTDKPDIPSDADDIAYDNTESGLTATNVQDAIDEVLTEGGKVQDVKVDGVSVVDTNKVAQIDLTGKADTDGTYDDMTVGTALAIKGKTVVSDNAPYVYRPSYAGDSAVDKLIGGTIAWNQLVKPSAVSASGTLNDITFSTNSDGSVHLNGTATADTAKSFVSGAITNSSHKYLILDANKTSGVYIYNGYLANGKVSCSVGGILTGVSQSWSATLYFFINNGTALNNVDVKIMAIDLTQAFGSTIADAVYTMEQSTAGSGIAWLKAYGFLTEDYYAYDAGSLQSVNASSHVTVGFNQWDEEWESGFIETSNGAKTTGDRVISKNYIKVAPNTVYYCSMGIAFLFYYDSNKNYITYSGPNATTREITTPNNCEYMLFYTSSIYGTTYNNNICINISDASKNGQYEAYVKHTYALDSSLTLRGIPKLSSNKLYYDGDTYEGDGSVTRKYGSVDLGSLNWTYNSTNEMFYTSNSTGALNYIKPSDNDNNVANALCLKYILTSRNNLTNLTLAISPAGASNYTRIFVKDTSYTDATTFKTAMSGVYLVYELATPTTETATGFTNPQVVDANGTEEYTDYGVQQQTRDVAIPVGHETTYTHEEEIELPLPASTNGTYTLKATRSASGVNYSWVADA